MVGRWRPIDDLSLTLTVVVGLIAATPATGVEPEGSATSEPPVDEVVVVGHRGEKLWLETPMAVGTVGVEEIQRAQQQLTLGESLGSMPGVFIQNRTNFAQDARISIRGFGARAPFGIRGIKLFVDGIPYTLPDGQGQVDSIDLSSAERIEVLRGPAAALYGSSSGGVIRIESEEGADIPYAHTRVSGGSYGYLNVQGRASGRTGDLRSLVSVAGTKLDGYRDHSQMKNWILNTNFRYELGDDSDLRLVLNHFDSPEANDPGGLTAKEVVADPTQANPRNVAFDAGEAIQNTIVGATYRGGFDEQNETRVSAYATWRDFDGRVPSSSRGAIDLDRFFGGGRVQHAFLGDVFGRSNRLSGGIEAEGQVDERLQRGIDGSTGAVTGVSVNERQTVTAVGVFLHDELEVFERLELTGSVRYDWVRFQVLDRYFGDSQDDSDELDFSEWSYAGAILWRGFRPATPYFRVATSFETPTTTGFANPNGGGFNPDLDAQTALSFELGLKGIIAERLVYELSVFHIRVDDELLPYQRNFSTFYENVEESKRFGVEIGMSLPLLRDLELSFSYTYSDFRFVEFDSQDGNNYDGNHIPGVPEHLVSLGLSYQHPLGFFADWDFSYVGERFANNANDAAAGGFTLSNLRLGFGRFIGGWELSGFVGLNNMSNASYIDNLRINALNGRYYEPAPRFNAYGGFSISYHFAGLAG